MLLKRVRLTQRVNNFYLIFTGKIEIRHFINDMAYEKTFVFNLIIIL